MAEEKNVILHVDDDEANRYAVTRSLTKAGFVVEEAADGTTALEKAAKHPDLIILDVRLPDIDGFEVCRRVKSDPATANIPILHLSASAITSEDKAYGLDGGADAYLVRPVEPVELVATVNALLRARRAEAALEEARSRIEATLAAAEVATWTWDIRADRVVADRNLARLFAISEEEAAGGAMEAYLRAIHPDDRSRVKSLIDATVREGGNYDAEYRIVRHDGSVRWVLARGQVKRDANGAAVSLPGVILDITDRILAELARRDAATRLEQQSRIFDTVLSAISDFAYTFDRNGRFVYINQALLDLWGLKLEQAVGKNFFDLKYPEELAGRLQRQIQQVFETGKVVRDETPYTSPTGSGGYYEYIFSPVFGADGGVEVVAGSTRDMTARRKMEEQLIKARDAAEAASRAKDAFLAVLSHELRTPLSPIVMSVTELEQHPDLPDDVRESMAMIRRNIDLETRLIDDLLDLSRVISGKLRLHIEQTSLHDILRHAYEVSASDVNVKRLTVKLEFSATNDRVMGDPSRLQQVFWNLMKNAVKFTPEDGTIAVRTTDVSPGRVRVEVADNGIGITPQAMSRIFGAFDQGDTRTTHRFGGLGLGLAICRAIVDMHGGTIAAVSAGAGRGATFTVEMDTVTVPANAAIPSSAAEQSGAHREAFRILLVEDHPDTARVMGRLLGKSGYLVSVADSVESAMKFAAAGPFDLVISDIGLPDANGYDLMRQLKTLYGMKGIALSGYGMDEDVRRGREAGFLDYVTKPVSLPQLQSAIERVLGQTNDPESS